MALASGVAVRYQGRRAGTGAGWLSHVLHKADEDRWAIAVTVVHDTDKVVRPE